jgi:nucleoside-diphosphate-sugar epimerase
MILLTGATGFLGGFLLDELLAGGHVVRALVRDPHKLASRPGLEVVDGDLLDVVALEKAMEGVDKVVHAAALVSFWGKRKHEMHVANVTGTANLVNAALDASITQFVHVSSVAALGRIEEQSSPIDEYAKWMESKYNTAYGRSKYLSELEVVRGVQEGLPAVICNPAIIIGPGNWNHGSPKLFSTIAKGMRFYNPGTTGFVAAVDVAKAVLLLLDSPVHDGRRYVLASDSLPYRTFFECVAQSVKATPPNLIPPKWLAALYARLTVISAHFTGKEPIITPETVTTSRGNFTYDGSKICRELGFSYSDLKQVILDTGALYLQSHAH